MRYAIFLLSVLSISIAWAHGQSIPTPAKGVSYLRIDSQLHGFVCSWSGGKEHPCTLEEMGEFMATTPQMLTSCAPTKRHHVKHRTLVNQCTITGAIKECAPVAAVKKGGL